ncbi:MAG: hypothetical protein ABI112_15345 [Terracoccus sp.]
MSTTTGKSDPALEQRLNDELDKFNAAATHDVAAAEELTVRMEEDGELSLEPRAGPGQAAGIGMTWVGRTTEEPASGRTSIGVRERG